MSEIICDYKEASSGIPEVLGKVLKMDVKFKALPVGDYRFKWLVVERKADYQFLVDWRSKQLDKQLANMIEWCNKRGLTPCLMSEADDKTEMKDKLIIEKHLRTLSKDIWCIRTFGAKYFNNSSPAVMTYYFSKIDKGEMLPGLRRPVGVRGKKNDQVNFVAGFYKVDEVTARKLLSHYGSVMAVMENVLSWSDDIKGIGPIVQARATELLHQRYKRG
jgi:ERCC4-type nuclease